MKTKNNNLYELSEQEHKLFIALRAEHYINLVSNHQWDIAALYSKIGEHAFETGFNCYTEPGASLARVLFAWHACKPYRKTPEFDALIKLP